MKKIIKIVGLILIVILIIVGIKIGSHQTATVIGVPLPLTGNSASLAERVKIAMEIALKDGNALANHKYVLAFEDDKADPQTEISVYKKLVELDQAKVLLGLIKSDPLLAIAPIAEKDKTVLLSATAGADKISDAGDYIFRLIEKANVHGETATNFIKEKNIDTVALLTADASNAKSYSNAFKIAWLNNNGKLPIELNYKPDETDFRTTIAKIKSENIKAVYIGVYTAKDAGLITKQLHEQGFSGIIMASPAAEAQEFFDTAGSYAEGVYITASFYDKNAPESQDFRNKFKAAYNKEADVWSANGYDSVRITIDASESCGGMSNPDCIRDYFYHLKNYHGISGTFSFDAKGDVIKPVLIKVARDGKFEVAE